MLQVIGISTTAEYLLKGLYENTIGRFTRWTASADTPEDRIIQQAHRAYGELIYTDPWYKFPFVHWVKKIWLEPSFFGENFIRKLERKLSFTLEFSFKSLYAKLIGFGAQTAYEQSDGLVTMLVDINPRALTKIDPRIKILKDFGNHTLVITLPRWGGFTEIMPKLADAGVRFVEISGNDNILVSTNAGENIEASFKNARYLFSSMVVSPKNMKRHVYSVKMSKLGTFLSSLKQRGMRLEHVFDY